MWEEGQTAVSEKQQIQNCEMFQKCPDLMCLLAGVVPSGGWQKQKAKERVFIRNASPGNLDIV